MWSPAEIIAWLVVIAITVCAVIAGIQQLPAVAAACYAGGDLSRLVYGEKRTRE